MANTIEMLNVSPSKQSSSQSNGVGIDEIVKALNKVTMKETVLMLTFIKLMDKLNQKLLQYSKWTAEASNASALYTQREDIISNAVGLSMAGTGLTMYSVNPEAMNPMHSGLIKYGTQLLIGLQAFGSIIQMYLTLNKGNLVSQTLKIQAATEKCKALIDFLKERLDSTTNTVKTMSNTEKDILEKDYNSKAKKLYFYNKRK